MTKISILISVVCFLFFMTTPIINKIQFIYSLSQPDFGNTKIMVNQRYDLHQNNIQLSDIHTEPQIVSCE